MTYLVVYLTLLAGGGTLAHYRGYPSGNLFVRDEPATQDDGSRVFVECPVCNNTALWPPLYEYCDITMGGRDYKQCKFGTYKNKACGNRIDCKRGPGDKCSSYDTQGTYDLRCAPGYHCDMTQRVCVGGSTISDSNMHYYLSILGQ